MENSQNDKLEHTPTLNAHNKEEFPPAHTAEHLLNQTMGRMFGCERSRNSHIERKKSKINFLIDRPLTQEEVADIEHRINALIQADLPVTYELVTRDNIPAGVTLAKLPDNASDTLRIVRIGDYDVCACLGTHVKSTREIGNFRITSTSYNEGSFRIVYKVAE
jgi:alanyl-tRNA synthetase